MTKKFSRILCIMLTVLIIISVIPATVFADDATPESEENKIFLSLGDSFSTGYGLEGYTASPAPYAKDSFVNIVAQKGGMDAINFAVDGLTSEGLDSMLKEAAADTSSELYKAIQSAYIIDITIGGNDLLKALFESLSTAFGISEVNSETLESLKNEFLSLTEGSTDTDVLAKLRLLVDTLNEAKTQIEPIAKEFSENLSSIIKQLKEINADAVIIVQTIPNPYAHMVPQIADTADSGVCAINNVITEKEAELGYKTADVYTVFKQADSVLTNASAPETYLDPHPNKYGHSLIADVVLKTAGIEALENTDIPELEIEFSKSYSDIKETDWYYDTVSELIDKGILNPEFNEAFNGDSEITKGEALEMIASALKLPVTIETLKEANLLPEDFDESAKIMRQELFVMIYDIMDMTESFGGIPNKKNISDFTDSSFIAEQAIEPITVLYTIGVIKGSGNASLKPADFATKAETAQIIYNLTTYLSVRV